MYRISVLLLLVLHLPCSAQEASAPGETLVQPGRSALERVDLTGDLIADVVLFDSTAHVPDTAQGLAGWHLRVVRLLPGTSLLLQSTPGLEGIFTLDQDAPLDTAALAKGFHFKQLQWSAADGPIEFRILKQPFGPGVAPAAMGWYGTGEYYDDTMVLRSTMGGSTVIAAFTIRFTLPAGRIMVTAQEVLHVPPDFGKEGDPSPQLPKPADPYGFGHEVEPQLIIPPGLPPDEPVDLNSDEVPDAVLTGHVEHWHCTGRCGYYVRGIAPAEGAAFLMQLDAGGAWAFFRLDEGVALTPELLAMGLQQGTMRWAGPEGSDAFCAVLRHPFGLPDQPQEWTLADDAPGDLVYRTMSYGQAIIGVVEIRKAVPGGMMSLDPQTWVSEGELLEVR